LEKLIELDYSWSAILDPNCNIYYAQSTYYYKDENGKRKQSRITMHELIMGSKLIDHIDHDGLNNRKYNLRKSTKTQNATHRKGRNKNNKSGHRNVSWNGNGWSVQIQIEGKNTCLKRFKKNQLEEAGEG